MLNVSCNSHCFLALCCALHRITSRVIHRTELFFFSVFTFDSYSMTNNNDLLNGKVYKQDGSDQHMTPSYHPKTTSVATTTHAVMCMLRLVSYIMVRHNHIGIYAIVRSWYVLMIELKKLNQKR